MRTTILSICIALLPSIGTGQLSDTGLQRVMCEVVRALDLSERHLTEYQGKNLFLFGYYQDETMRYESEKCPTGPWIILSKVDIFDLGPDCFIVIQSIQQKNKKILVECRLHEKGKNNRYEVREFKVKIKS